MDKILLTGGAGLIGSNVALELNKHGYTDIIITDKLGLSPYKWKNLSKIKYSDYIEWDDFAKNEYKYGISIMEKVSVIIALGAHSYTTEKNAAFLIRNNYETQKWLAIHARDNNARFVYASSAATYGAGEIRDQDDSEYLSSLRPLNVYGYSKHLFDLWMTRQGWGNATGLKYTNIFGSHERHKGDQRSLVCKAYDSLKSGKPIELFQSARQDIKMEEIRRDFLWVGDAAKITVWFALDEKGQQANGLFNVGSGVSTSFCDLAKFTIESFANVHGANWMGVKDGYIHYVPMPEELRGRYQYVTQVSIEKLRRAGYEGEIMPIKKAIDIYVKEWLSKEEQ